MKAAVTLKSPYGSRMAGTMDKASVGDGFLWEDFCLYVFPALACWAKIFGVPPGLGLDQEDA